MTRSVPRLLTLLAVAAAALSVVAAPAGADPAWTPAQALPGMSALNTTGVASVTGISCSSAGNCGVTGVYSDSLRHVQGFVANEVGFTWGPATSIPGLIDLNAGGAVLLPAISCTAATSCSVTGTYAGATPQSAYGFVDDETNGTWGTAQTLPLSSSLPTGAQSLSDTIKCTSPGNCVVSGGYADVNGVQAFVATETSGTWAGAAEVPGTGALNAPGGLALGTWLDCPASGSCTLTGVYTDSGTHIQTWVDSESGGAWGTAQAVPGLATLNVGGDAEPNSVSCSSPGNCAIGGFYSLSTSQSQPFVADEVSGTWQSAEEVPGALTLNAGTLGAVTEVACPADGQCEAVGVYTDVAGGSQAFVDRQVGGSWQSMSEMPGSAELNASGRAQFPDLSCVSAGDCRAVGGYGDSSNAVQAFDTTEVAGVWQNGEETPGTASLNAEGAASWDFVSCTPDGGCAAAGTYKDSSGYFQVMVMSTAAPATAPGAPTERLASKAVGVVTVTITPPSSNGGSPITGYQYSVNGGAWRSTSSTHVTIRHLKPKSKVRVRVRAVNSVGPGAASGTATIKVK